MTSEDIGGNAKRQKSEESVLLREQASGSHQSAAYHLAENNYRNAWCRFFSN